MAIKWSLLIISVLAVVVTAAIGSLFTDTGSWYNSIKPSITPPNIVFPIAWTTLFVLIAISMYFSLSNSNKKQKTKVSIMFSINLVLNVLWTLFFFGLKNPLLALVEIIVLWLSILALMLITWKMSKLSSWLLLPYLLWVAFAALLNILIVIA